MTNRIDKLNAEFKRYIAELLTKKVKDLRITEMFTILEVDCDRELSSAKVYVSIFSTDANKAAQTFVAIRENEPFIRREISKNMRIRKAPQFNFILDTSMAYGQKISEILNELKTEDDN